MSNTPHLLSEVEADPDHAKALARAICLERYPRERSEGWTGCPGICAKCRAGAAAVTRLLADQVAPMPSPMRWPTPMSGECMRIRADMLAIATELEGVNG
jgi:hypothetical protein